MKARQLRQVHRPWSFGQPPTDRQNEVLRFIAAFIAGRGMPPSVDDLMEGLGIGSPNGVVSHLDALIGRGLIEVEAKTARGIRLVGAGWVMRYSDDEAGERLRRALEGEP